MPYLVPMYSTLPILPRLFKVIVKKFNALSQYKFWGATPVEVRREEKFATLGREVRR